MKSDQPPQEIQYSTCRADEGGSPKCALGCIKDNTTVEVRGASFDLVYQVQTGQPASPKRKLALDREYDVMIVLEAPGQMEDWRGVPTVGDAGNVLSDFVLQAGFNLDRVYISNIVKCRPPSNRNPTVSEIKACRPHLEYEIRKIKPKVIMLLGNASLRLFNLHSEGGIYKIRGNHYTLKLPSWQDGPTFNVIPTFHPAMFLHKTDEQAQRRSQDDYIMAANISKDQMPKQKKHDKYHIIKTDDQLEWLIEEIRESEFTAFDTESRALGFRKEPLICFSFCWGYDPDTDENKTAVLPIYHHTRKLNSLGWALEPHWGTRPNRMPVDRVFDQLRTGIFEDVKVHKAAHNLKYDALVLRRWAKSELKGVLFDTMLLHHMLHEQKPHGLEYLADLEFAVGDYSSRLHNIVGKGKNLLKTYDWIPDHILWPYAALDAQNTFRLACLYTFRMMQRGLDEELPNGRLYRCYTDRVVPLSEVLVDAEWYGIKIDTDLVKIIKKEYEDEQEQLLSKIRQATGEPEFNPSSVQQVRAAIIKAGLGDKIKDKDAASGYTTSRDRLKEVAAYWNTGEDILRYRTNRKMLSTYIETVLNDTEDDGRIRKSFLIHGTDSTRLSCPLLHQIPRNDEKRKNNLRDFFVAEDGFNFIYQDFKQVELKVHAVLVYQLTGDDSLIKLYFDPNISAHKRTAALILDVSEDQINAFNKSLGKTFNFGILFGSEGYELLKQQYESLSDGKRYNVSKEMVDTALRKIHKECPGIREYARMVPEITRSQKGVYINAFGREFHMGKDLFSRNSYLRKVAEREIVNRTVQSAASQITCDTMTIAHAQNKKWVEQGTIKKGDFRIINTVHDSIKSEVREKLTSWATGFMQKVAERPIPELNKMVFTTEIGVGKSWSEAEANAK